MVRNERVLSYIASLQGEYGIDSILMGVPIIIGTTEVECVPERTVKALEREAMRGVG